jgi:hypothetical protein
MKVYTGGERARAHPERQLNSHCHREKPSAARKRLTGEIWQRGFSDVRVTDELSFKQHQEYIANNPIKAGLAISPEDFQYGTAYLKKRKRAGAEAQSNTAARGTAKVVP